MTEEVDTVISNPLTGEVTTKLAEIEPDEVPDAGDLPEDVPSTEIPPELQPNEGEDPEPPEQEV